MSISAEVISTLSPEAVIEVAEAVVAKKPAKKATKKPAPVAPVEAPATEQMLREEFGIEPEMSLNEKLDLVSDAIEKIEIPENDLEAPAAKLVFLDVATGKPVESRRVPSEQHGANAERLVAAHGWSTFTIEQAAALGIDADGLDHLIKRLRSWFGKAAVVRGKDGWVLNLKAL